MSGTVSATVTHLERIMTMFVTEKAVKDSGTNVILVFRLKLAVSMAIGDLPFSNEDSDCCFVLMDGQTVCGPTDFRSSVMATISLYYVFKVEYPSEAAAT